MEAISQALYQNQGYILSENEKDLAAAMSSGMKQSLLDRLALSSQRIDGIVEGVRPGWPPCRDPIGEVTRMSTRPNGLTIGKRAVPPGGIGIIYEARPNVTTDAIGLCIKAGNAVILRGGSEAIRSNLTIARICSAAAYEEGLPAGAVGMVEDTSRAVANEMMRLNDYIDVLIPRGGPRPHQVGGAKRHGAHHRDGYGQLPYLCRR